VFDIHPRQDVVEVDYHILSSVAHHNEEASLLFLNAIFDERKDSRVTK
jgi:hypothetical protein